MALVQSKWRVSVNFAETSGKTVRRTYEAPVANFASFAAFQTFLTTASTGFLAVLITLTDAVIASYQAEAVYIEDALSLPAAAENQNQALLSFKIDGDPTESGTLSIPAADPDIFISPTGEGHDIVQITDVQVQLFLSFFTGGELAVSDDEYVDLATAKGRRRNVASSGT